MNSPISLTPFWGEMRFHSKNIDAHRYKKLEKNTIKNIKSGVEFIRILFSNFLFLSILVFAESFKWKVNDSASDQRNKVIKNRFLHTRTDNGKAINTMIYD